MRSGKMKLRTRSQQPISESPSKLSTHTDQMDIEEHKNYEIDEDLLEYDEENKASRYSPAKSIIKESDSPAPEMFSSLLKLRDSLSPLSSKYIPDFIKAHKRFPTNSIDSLTHVLDPSRSNDRSEGLYNSNQQLMDKYRAQFPKWSILVDCGFNILLYNIGSKMHILNEFYDYLSTRGGVRIIAHGFHTAFNVRRLLNDIMKAVNIYPSRTRTLQDVVFRLQHELQDNIYIFLHNLDGMHIRDVESQELLGLLAAHPYVTLITTLDNHWLVSQWSLQTLNNFNFQFISVPTFEEYTAEMHHFKDKLNLFDRVMSDSLSKGLKYVLQSLTQNQRETLKCLANLLEQQPEGISFKELFLTCKEEMLVIQEKQLRDHLVEAKDHQIIYEKKGKRGETIVCMRHAPSSILSILSNF